MKLIESEEAVKRIASVARLAKSDPQKELLGRCIYIIEHCPVVDAEPIRNFRWENSLDGKPFCTGCGRAFRFSNGVPKYCPECGARMNENRKE